MKRKFSFVLLLMLVVCCVFACGTAADGTTATTEATIPEGYTTYSNGDISFAYPSAWKKQAGSVVMLVNESGVGNNITVAYEAKTNMYNTFTVADFNSMMKPAYEAMGMAVKNPAVSHKEVGGEKVNVISYTATVSGKDIKQTQYIVNAGEYTYVITVTETEADAALVKNVFETIKVLK